MKRTLALAVACALVLEGCGESDAPGEARKKTVLEYASMKDIRNINPHLYLGEMAAQAMVFEPLVFNTPEGVKPALAERWEISGDGRTYTFHLRRGVKFTDGTPFTADAVKKNIDAVMANRTRHAWLDMINEIESSEVVDEHTWRLHLRHPYFPALIELGLSRPFRFISPACMKDGGTKDGVTCLAGTGPWVLSEHKDQQYALFSRNEGYWGDKPIVPTVRWNVVPDTQTMLMALEKGEIDLVFGADGDQLTGDAFKKLTDEKRLNTAVSEPIASRAILVNSKRPITKDVRVREALAYAFNRQAVVDGILNGTEAAAMTLFAKSVPYCDVPLKERGHDPKKAVEILDAAGWKAGADGIRTKDGARLVLDFYFNSNNAQEKTIAEAMQGDLLKIGVELRVIGEEKQAFLDRPAHGRIRPAVLALLGRAVRPAELSLLLAHSRARRLSVPDRACRQGAHRRDHHGPHDRGRREEARRHGSRRAHAHHGCGGLHPRLLFAHEGRLFEQDQGRLLCGDAVRDPVREDELHGGGQINGRHARAAPRAPRADASGHHLHRVHAG